MIQLSSYITEAQVLMAQELINQSNNVVILTHMSPDGDAMGSSLAIRHFLEAQGKQVNVIVPNAFPDFLAWLPKADLHIIYEKSKADADAILEQAELIICTDFNDPKRIGSLGDKMLSLSCKKMMIDHHLHPADFPDLTISYPACPSTCELVYRLIRELQRSDLPSTGVADLQRSDLTNIATCIYTGMMTDTGNFSFSHLTPELYRSLAVLCATGINIPQIYNNVYNSFTEGRARLFGYTINRKMKTLRKGTVAYMSLTEDEMRRFWFQQGDSEGFVNYPLTVKKMRMSAIFIEHTDFIRVSLRSRGKVDVNVFAGRYFEGGGHKNAAGGKSYVSMEETIARFEAAVEEYAKEGLL